MLTASLSWIRIMPSTTSKVPSKPRLPPRVREGSTVMITHHTREIEADDYFQAERKQGVNGGRKARESGEIRRTTTKSFHLVLMHATSQTSRC